MKKAEISIGGVYQATVSGFQVHVEILALDASKGWKRRGSY